MNAARILNIFSIFTLWMFPLMGQFSEVTVNIDTRMLRGNTESYILTSLKDQIESYFLTTEFAPDAADLALTADIRLVIESITDGGNKKIISGQALISNRYDQQYFAKGFEFPFEKGQAFIFAPVFNPTVSFFDFYAFLLIAGELDTWEDLGGNPYYGRAQSIASDGRASSYVRGWETRYKRAKIIKENLDLRHSKFYFYLAMDQLSQDTKSGSAVKKARESLKAFVRYLDDGIYKFGYDRYTEIFLKTHAPDLAEMMKALNLTDELTTMIELDSENKEIYQAALKK